MSAFKSIALAAVACAGMAACTTDPAAALKGEWGNEEYCMAFDFKDGDSVTVTWFGSELPSTYRVSGDSLIVAILYDEAVFTYELKGDTLWLNDEGEAVPFIKGLKIDAGLDIPQLDVVVDDEFTDEDVDAVVDQVVDMLSDDKE